MVCAFFINFGVYYRAIQWDDVWRAANLSAEYLWSVRLVSMPLLRHLQRRHCRRASGRHAGPGGGPSLPAALTSSRGTPIKYNADFTIKSFIISSETIWLIEGVIKPTTVMEGV